MLSLPISSSTALPALTAHSHGGHRHGLKNGLDQDSSAGGIGQLPSGVGQSLLSSLLQSLQQTVGVQTTGSASAAAPATAAGSTSAVAAAGSATSATAAPAGASTTAQDLHAFLHSLFQTLKQDGMGAGGTTAATSAAGTTPASQYQGSVISSLQTLIGQIGGSAGAASGATDAASGLTASFHKLVQDLNGGASTAAAAAGGTTASLQSFLSTFLQNLQSSSQQALQLVGANVNANV